MKRKISDGAWFWIYLIGYTVVATLYIVSNAG